MKLAISTDDFKKEIALGACYCAIVITGLVLIVAVVPASSGVAYGSTSATLNREFMIDAFLNTGVFQANKTIVHNDTDTGLYTIIFIRAGNDNSTQYMAEDTATTIAERYGYDLVVYDFNELGELVIVLQQQAVQVQACDKAECVTA